MNRKLKKDLKTAFSAPVPSRKNEFLSNITYPKTNYLDFFFSQIWYIRKRFWFLSALIAVTLILLIQLFNPSVKAIVILSSFFPFCVVLSISEISRSTSYNMEEMEMSCKYNLSKITLVRLALISSVHFILFFFMIIIFANNSEYSVLRFLLYCITPSLICAYLSLYITNHFYSNEIVYICAGVAGVISLSVFLLTKNYEIIYSQESVLCWCLVFIFTINLLVKETKNLIKQSEELQWNS